MFKKQLTTCQKIYCFENIIFFINLPMRLVISNLGNKGRLKSQIAFWEKLQGEMSWRLNPHTLKKN